VKITCHKISDGFIPIERDIDKIRKIPNGSVIEITIKIEKRTDKQNNCLHGYLGQMSTKMNEAGYDFKKVVQLPVSFTTSNMKEYMFKPVMTGMYPEITSTTELSTIQIQQVYETFNNAMGVKFGISGNWPDRFTGGKV